VKEYSVAVHTHPTPSGLLVAPGQYMFPESCFLISCAALILLRSCFCFATYSENSVALRNTDTDGSSFLTARIEI
jgi:hypothetical protein